MLTELDLFLMITVRMHKSTNVIQFIMDASLESMLEV